MKTKQIDKWEILVRSWQELLSHGFLIDFTFSKVSMIFSFHFKISRIDLKWKKCPGLFPEGVNDANRFDNVYATQVSWSLTGIVSIIDFVALNDAHF